MIHSHLFIKQREKENFPTTIVAQNMLEKPLTTDP